MQVELRIRQFLEQDGRLKRGIINELAGDLGIHRHSVRKLINGEAESISLKTLGNLCQWLQREREVPADELPQVLFGYRPEALWEAVADTGRATLYLGEYLQVEEGSPLRLWVSQRDMVLAGAIVEELNTDTGAGKRAPIIHHEYVPFRFATGTPDISRRYFDQDSDKARRMFLGLRGNRTNAAHILIGSAEVNYLVECWVADLFGCKPFVAPEGEPRVPFYMKSRHTDTGLESCHAGRAAPFGYKGRAQPGIFYLNEKGTWVACPWVRDRKDAGLVAIVRRPGANATEMVIYGFSGRATAAMATHVVRNAKPFWPLYYESKARGIEIGVYVCKFTLGGSPTPAGADTFQTKKMDVVPISPRILNRFLSQAAEKE